MRNISVFVESRFPVNRKIIRQFVDEYLNKEHLKDVEVNISIVGDRKMKYLNKTYRWKDEATTVLSFALEDDFKQGKEEDAGFISSPDHILRLGDVVISYPQAVLRSGEDNMLVEDKLKELLIHGLNNLVGKSDTM